MHGWWKRLYPTVLALAGSAVVYRWGRHTLSDGLVSFVGGGAAIAVGFTVTAMTVLIAIQDRPVMTLLKDSKSRAYDRLLSYCWEAVCWWFPALGICAAVLFLEIPRFLPQAQPYLPSVLALVTVGGAAAWFRIAKLIVEVLRTDAILSDRRLHAEDPPPGRAERTSQ
jgi:hypothetical protein